MYIFIESLLYDLCDFDDVVRRVELVCSVRDVYILVFGIMYHLLCMY